MDMRFRVLWLAGVIGVTLALDVASASNTASEQTMGEYLLNMPVRTTKPFTTHCAESMPELSDELDIEYRAFLDKVSIAIEPLIERLASEPEFEGPIPPEVRSEFEKIEGVMLSEIGKQELGVYCPGLILNLRNATVKQIRTLVEESYNRYMLRSQSAGKD